MTTFGRLDNKINNLDMPLLDDNKSEDESKV